MSGIAENVGPEAMAAARAARLRYVTDQMPGIHREKWGEGFRYRSVAGALIEDEKSLERIQALALPPAYTDVWICPLPNGHLQATGRDAKGRKQYRYHERWRAVRDETKFDRMIAFGEVLPALRERVVVDITLPGLPREKALAAVVRLLDKTHIRIGNAEYALQNESFGLTTLRAEHVELSGAEITFRFRGKSGKEHEIGVRDPRVARIVKRARDLPGQELFTYEDGAGGYRTLTSDDVNAYLHEVAGEEFTAKDFRTWAGTTIFASALASVAPYETKTEATHNVVEAVKEAAFALGNTPSICRKCYIHPEIETAYLNGSFSEKYRLPETGDATGERGLKSEESALLRFLRRRGSHK